MVLQVMIVYVPDYGPVEPSQSNRFFDFPVFNLR